MHEEKNTHKEKEISLFTNDILTTHLQVFIKKHQQEIDEKNDYTLDPEDLFIKIDINACDSILNNIIDNAVKYNDPIDGNINVSLYEENMSVILKLTDTGIGIPPDQLHNIFKPYYQSTSEKRSTQGIGMGLFIVKSILKEIDAEISIESRRAIGTTVTIEFNKVEVTECNRNKISKDEPLSLPAFKKDVVLKKEIIKENRKTIFFVEDNRELIAFMQNSLSSDYNFYYAKDGIEGLRKLKRILPDIIISDIMMDVMNGYVFYDKIKETAKFQGIPFIFLTAKTTIEDRIKGLKQGAVDFIQKPFHIAELKEKIHSLLKNKEEIKKQNMFKLKNKISAVLNDDDDILLRLNRLCKKYRLTSRERDVVARVIHNLTDKEIAAELFIAHATAINHVKNIRKKLGVKHKHQIIQILYE